MKIRENSNKVQISTNERITNFAHRAGSLI